MQISLDLPSQLSIKVDEALYFRNENVEIGNIFEIALEKQDTNLNLIHLGGNQYKKNDGKGYPLLMELNKKAGKYTVTGCVKNIEQSKKTFIEDFRMNGKGENGECLRPAQAGAVYSLLSHWSLSNDVATVVLPTGTGKTETMLVATLASQAKKTLVIVPTIDLKKQIADKFSTWGILRELGVISDKTPNPTVLVLNKTLSSKSAIPIINDADVVISTPAFIARATPPVKKELVKLFTNVYFDEAHHIQAKEWDLIKSLFKNSKVVQFTATPYRYDKKPIEGKVIYNYPLSQAITDNCFSKISLVSVEESHPKKKDEAIARAAMNRLIADRAKGWTDHRMMVRVEKKEQAEILLEKYQKWFPDEKIVVVHSQIRGKSKIIERIKNNEYDIVICVDMLKEGFDYPNFKIAAVHTLHKSISVLLQFIGRFARTKSTLGSASFVVNYAEEKISVELENLFQEGSGWEEVISEIADAKKKEAESLLSFLQGCQPYSGFDSPDIKLNPKLVYPALSCVCFKCEQVDWSNFKDAFDIRHYALSQPYYNESENVFYFATQKREKVKWARADEIRDQTWNLIVLYHDKDTKLLYVGYSEKRLDLESLIASLTKKDPVILNGDCVFRSFDKIKRLSIVHAGIFKPANHLHRYSRLSGADVTNELTKWKTGQRCKKSDFVGVGFRDGFPISIGASVKGKIWSPAKIGNVKEWKEWCINIGKLITNENIDSDFLLENSAQKTELKEFPENLIVLASDWSETLYDRIDKITFEIAGGKSFLLSECTLKCITVGKTKAEFEIRIVDDTLNFAVELGGEQGHFITGLDSSTVMIEGLKSKPITIKKFFEENPPTIFLLDGSTIAGCIYTNYGEAAIVQIPDGQIHALEWNGVDYKIESMYKKKTTRSNSIQEYMMKAMVERGALLVFNDDNSGESADIVAVFSNDDLIKFELIHCKYSKEVSGARLNDLFEVCGQTIVSLRYKWKPEDLLKHLERRNQSGVLKGLRFYHGNIDDVGQIRKDLKYKNVEFEFSIAQPGVKVGDLTIDMKNFLGSVYSTVIEMTETKLKCYFNLH